MRDSKKRLLLICAFVTACIALGCRPMTPAVPTDPAACIEPPEQTPLSAVAENVPSKGLVLWLRADVGIGVDGENRVCLWKDQSGNRFDVQQKDPAARPRAGAKLNGHPAINVDPNQGLKREDALGIDATSGRTIVAVYALDTVSTRFSIMQGNVSSNSVWYGLDDNTYGTAGSLFGCYAPNGQAYDGNVKTDAQPHVHSVVFDTFQPGAPTTSVLRRRVDSADMKLVYRCCDSSMKIGDFRSANVTAVPWSGDATLAEVMLYDRPLEAAELEHLESVLKARYRIAQ